MPETGSAALGWRELMEGCLITQWQVASQDCRGTVASEAALVISVLCRREQVAGPSVASARHACGPALPSWPPCVRGIFPGGHDAIPEA